MKNNLLLLVGIMGMCMMLWGTMIWGIKNYNTTNSTTYMKSAEVIQIRDNVVYLEDTSGNIWTVEDDTLKLYGRYVVTFDSMGTEDIIDDEIVEVN